jgi:2-polyprenyl-3-methyl-5-hydroxy-6-metoxy-1,4-benzoquinol methylase
MMSTEHHWERVYGAKAPDEVSGFRPHLETSLALIKRAAGNRSSAIIDVGGGESTLLDDLIARGYGNVTCLDISETAIEVTKKRLGHASQLVHWIHADITRTDLPKHFYDVWHDRAVFHFLMTRKQRVAYVRQVASAVKPGGHVIVATFGPEGPIRCSGLDVSRYDAHSFDWWRARKNCTTRHPETLSNFSTVTAWWSEACSFGKGAIYVRASESAHLKP